MSRPEPIVEEEGPGSEHFEDTGTVRIFYVCPTCEASMGFQGLRLEDVAQAKAHALATYAVHDCDRFMPHKDAPTSRDPC